MANKQDEGMTVSKAKEILRNYDKEMSESRKRENDFFFQREAINAQGFIEGWDAAIRSCADEIREPCPYSPEPCGDCRHCFATKTAIRILKLQSEGEK